MPATMGRCRYENASLANCARFSPVASASLDCATYANQSKYDHHSAAATTNPSSAAPMAPASSEIPLAPVPIDAIDSPSAMMTMRPNRSTKCEADTRHPCMWPTRAPM